MLVTFDMVSGETRCEKTSSEEEQSTACPQRLVPHIRLGSHAETAAPPARPIPRITDLGAFLNEMAAYR